MILFNLNRLLITSFYCFIIYLCINTDIYFFNVILSQRSIAQKENALLEYIIFAIFFLLLNYIFYLFIMKSTKEMKSIISTFIIIGLIIMLHANYMNMKGEENLQIYYACREKIENAALKIIKFKKIYGKYPTSLTKIRFMGEYERYCPCSFNLYKLEKRSNSILIYCPGKNHGIPPASIYQNFPQALVNGDSYELLETPIQTKQNTVTENLLNKNYFNIGLWILLSISFALGLFNRIFAMIFSIFCVLFKIGCFIGIDNFLLQIPQLSYLKFYYNYMNSIILVCIVFALLLFSMLFKMSEFKWGKFVDKYNKEELY